MKYIKSIWFSLIALYHLIASQECEKIVRRRDIREISRTDRQRYFNAIRALNKKGPSGESEYDKLAATHINLTKIIHHNSLFLPWHRMFLRRFELALQKIDPGVTVPYWDWTRESQHPEDSFIFGSDMLGGNGRSFDGRVVDGQFANWLVTSADMKYENPGAPDIDFDDEEDDEKYNQASYLFKPHYLQRQWPKQDQIGAFCSYQQVESIIKRSKDYLTFYQYLESFPHSLIHTKIGNRLKDMSSQASPNDPIFWAHHAFLDLIWHEWQRRNPHLANTYIEDIFLFTERSKLSYVMPPFNVTVADALSTKSRYLCYDYPKWEPREKAKEKALKESRAPRSNGEAEKVNTKQPQQVSEKQQEVSETKWNNKTAQGAMVAATNKTAESDASVTQSSESVARHSFIPTPSSDFNVTEMLTETAQPTQIDYRNFNQTTDPNVNNGSDISRQGISPTQQPSDVNTLFPVVVPTTSTSKQDQETQTNQVAEADARGVIADAFREKYKKIGKMVMRYLMKNKPEYKSKSKQIVRFAKEVIRVTAHAIEIVEDIIDQIIKGNLNPLQYAQHFAKYNPHVDAFDRRSKKLRIPEPVPTRFLRRNNIDIARARQIERELAQVNILLNGLNGANLDQNVVP